MFLYRITIAKQNRVYNIRSCTHVYKHVFISSVSVFSMSLNFVISHQYCLCCRSEKRREVQGAMHRGKRYSRESQAVVVPIQNSCRILWDECPDARWSRPVLRSRCAPSCFSQLIGRYLFTFCKSCFVSDRGWCRMSPSEVLKIRTFYQEALGALPTVFTS